MLSFMKAFGIFSHPTAKGAQEQKVSLRQVGAMQRCSRCGENSRAQIDRGTQKALKTNCLF
jgi:hypothetical protein